jgi:hypothetical protein
MIRLSFEIVEQPPSVVIHGKREYNHKTPTEEFYAALVAPIMSKALKRLATVQEAGRRVVTRSCTAKPASAC